MNFFAFIVDANGQAEQIHPATLPAHAKIPEVARFIAVKYGEEARTEYGRKYTIVAASDAAAANAVWQYTTHGDEYAEKVRAEINAIFDGLTIPSD